MAQAPCGHANERRLAGDPAKDDALILVNLSDQQIGTVSKERAHREGLLHRAFSVVLWREGAGGREVLLARRAACKYHSAGLWANSCCSHPRDGEELMDAAYRRVAEELGCTVEGLREIGAFAYRAAFAEGLVEYEYDHVLLGNYDGEVFPDPGECDAVRWVAVGELARELADARGCFAVWAPRVLSMALEELGVG